MDPKDTSPSISSWNDSQFSYDMQGPMDMTYDEAFTEVMQCFLPIQQPDFAALSSTGSSPIKSFTPQSFKGMSDGFVDTLNPSFSPPSSRSQSPASSSPTSQIDLTVIHKLSKRQRNRDAQRAYRERKERLLHTLAEKVEKVEAAYNAVKEERDQLRQKLDSLTEPLPPTESDIPTYNDQFASFTNFQFDNYLFSNLPRHQIVLPLS
ncbi:hypothetical protein TsFJ059_006412 [Trichoderma semiorbis]|uniref:BZIP domain-containing protein n=1 Tax=Trichoderma semiorbis TaxID=1491008 RepID=A0A9P8HJE4_9HYPO|nr:hypothetical protein TsFJ059_006412 [Trichoderma semiorbis]